MQLVPGWMVVIIIGREITVLGLRNIASAEGFTIPASALGKTKMVLQVIAVCAVILGAKHTDVRPLGTILVWLVVMSAVASAVQYFSKFWSHVDDRVKQNGATCVCSSAVEKHRMLPRSDLALSDEDRRALLARRVRPSSKRLPVTFSDLPPVSGRLAEPGGAFVTLRCDGKLRGCIGRAEAAHGLAETVVQCAITAALQDPRFAPLCAGRNSPVGNRDFGPFRAASDPAGRD